MTAVVSVKVREPQFEGQTKSKLGNAEVRVITDSVFTKYFNNHGDISSLLLKILKIILWIILVVFVGFFI